MTTIAFKDGVMASDSQCTDDQLSMRLTNCDKVFRLQSGALLGTAGDDDARELVGLLENATSLTTMPSRAQLAATQTCFSGLLYLPAKTLWLVEAEITSDGWVGCVSEIRHSCAAAGSGRKFAYGAMEHGATAKEAVEVACKYDIYSSKPVQQMRMGK